MSNPMQDSVDDIKDIQNKFHDAAKIVAENDKNDREVDGISEEKTEDVNTVLFDNISESTIKILQDPLIEESFNVISASMGDDATKALINVIAIAMSNSAFQAILFYDDLLKRELMKQFDNIGHHINLGKSDLEAYRSTLQVFKKQLEEINQKVLIDELKTNIKCNDNDMI